jgi:16S rRNA (adenine1518-N6/adenine1519-N6)-dimethyltransferase
MRPIIQKTLKNEGYPPLKRLGQNFLTDKKAVAKIIEAAQVGPKDTIVEIGPGTGALTLELAKKAGQVIAIEKDERMCSLLEKTLADFGNVKVLNQDIRFWPGPEKGVYKVVANLPFYLSSLIIRNFLERANQPEDMVLIIQKEVAQRINAKVPDMSLLAVAVQFYAKTKIISYLSKKSFWPQPEVDAAIIQITPLKQLKKVEPEKFFLVAKAGFSQPRKKLINNLANKLKIKKEEVEKWLLDNNLSLDQRAETLSLEDWIKLAKSFRID